METKNDDRTLGSLFRDLTEDLSTLVRSEIALAKHEIKQTAVSLGAASALFLAALFAAFCAGAFLLVTIVLVLALFIQAWAAALIVTVVMLAAAAGLAILGRNKIRKVEFVPAATIASVKSDVDSIRREFSGKRGAA